MARFTSIKADRLRCLREEAGLTQKQASHFFHLHDRETIAAWETGQSAPREAQRREALIIYLLDKLNLRRAPQQFLTLWHDLMVMEWQWQAISQLEITRYLPNLTLPTGNVGQALPAQPNILIDRKHDMTKVSQLLMQGEGRLLTLHGPPGVGKTRLGLAVAAQVRAQFAQGVYFVSLAPITHRTGLLTSLADLVGARALATDEALLHSALMEFLRRRHTLLLLDNFEQVLEAAPLIAELLTGCPWLRILITSRVALNVRFEQRYALAPLALADAVALFVQRAQMVNADFTLTKANRATVAELCQQLDCLPLAVELMAARSDTLSPTLMLQGLKQHGLDLLNAGPKDAPLRQQTMRNTIEHSVALLTKAESRLFSILGAFVGGCTQAALTSLYQAARPVPLVANQTETINGLLTALVQKNLLTVNQDNEQQPRFQMLETLRQYAYEKLLADPLGDSVFRQHASYFCEQAEVAQPHLTGQAQKTWLIQLERERHNCTAALEWALAHQELDLALRLAGALWPYWEWRSHYRPAIMQLRRVLQFAQQALIAREPPAQQAERIAQVYLGLAALELWGGDLTEAQEALDQSQFFTQALPPNLLTVRILHYQAMFAARCGDYAQADQQLADIATLLHAFPQLDEMTYRWEMAHIDEQRAQNAFYQADLVVCTELATRARTAYAALGDELREAATVHLLGCAALYGEQPNAAEILLTQSLTSFAELGEGEEQLTTCFELGCLALQRNDLLSARQHFRECLTQMTQQGNLLRVYYPLWGMARYALAQHQPSLVARLLGATHYLVQQVNHVLPPIYQALYQQNLATTEAQLGHELFAALFQEGATFSPLQAAETALRIL